MNLFELRIVLRQLKKDLTCPHCSSQYTERSVEIIGTTKNTGLFLAKCKNCQNSIIVNVNIERKHRKISAKKKHQWRIGESISANEVLDMKNFLHEFNGDLSSLIKVTDER